MTDMKIALGLELGSTRIKAVAINENHVPVSSGDYTWKSSYENGVWTYDLAEVWKGLKTAVSGVENRESVKAMGVSAMMHGYLAFDADWNLLVPFRTWQNTITGQAAAELTEAFTFNVPQRWSISHLYQAVLNNEEHISRIAHITTLAGYVHYMLTGVNAIGVGEASGMFPIDSEKNCYDETMLAKFNELPAVKAMPWKLIDILPAVLVAGDNAGTLTESGAAMLDGLLPVGIPFAPAEGDAGTGMTATNAVAPRTGNVSAGTSIFSMVVLEKNLSKLYQDIDMVTTPSGRPVAMVHCNNGASELDAWMRMFGEILKAVGADVSGGELYGKLFNESLNGAADCDDVTLFNYISGEPVTGLNDGRPLLVRRKDSKLTLANFMRSQIYSIFASLAVGHRILDAEQVRIKRLTGHGGLFKTPGVAQKYLAAAMNAPVTVMKTAGEGGPYGMALLAAYLLKAKETTLEDYLENVVFGGAEGSTMAPDAADVAGYAAYLKAYCDALDLEHTAVKCVK